MCERIYHRKADKTHEDLIRLMQAQLPVGDFQIVYSIQQSDDER